MSWDKCVQNVSDSHEISYIILVCTYDVFFAKKITMKQSFGSDYNCLFPCCSQKRLVPFLHGSFKKQEI